MEKHKAGSSDVSSVVEELLAISDRCSALPDLDMRTPEEVLGFDDDAPPGSLPWSKPA